MQPLIAIAVALIAAAVLGGLLWRLNRKPASPRTMVCGRCAYPVGGLPDFTCPECGTDLRTTGIFPAAPRSYIARIVSLGLAWTIAVWSSAAVIIYSHGSPVRNIQIIALFGGTWLAGLVLLPLISRRVRTPHR